MEHFDWIGALVIPYTNFFIFAGILAFVARKPLRNLASKRRQEYQALLAAARQAQAEADARLAVLNQRLASLDSELASMRQQAQQDAAAEARRIVERGQELAAHLKAEAQRIAEGELLRAKETLRADVIAAVRSEVAAQVTEEWDQEAQRQYVQSKAADLKQIIARA